jgi:hypothetical protein
MYPRTEYKMTEDDLVKILDACKPTPCMMIGSYTGSSPQENANRAWAELGKRMGFDEMTVRSVDGKGSQFFTAVPRENETQRAERVKREAAERNAAAVKTLRREIEERTTRLSELIKKL